MRRKKILENTLWRPTSRRAFDRFIFLYLLALLACLISDFPYFTALHEIYSFTYSPVPLLRLLGLESAPGIIQCKLLMGGLLGAIVAAMLGVRPRLFLAIAAVLFLVADGTYESLLWYTGYKRLYGHTKLLTIFVLLVLACSRETAAYRPLNLLPGRPVPRIHAAPLFTIQSLLALTFLSAGVCKAVSGLRGGFFWGSPDHIGEYLLLQALTTGRELPYRVATSPLLAGALGISVMFLQLATPWLVLSNRFRWIFPLALASFLAGSYFVMGIDFFAYYGIALLAFATHPWREPAAGDPLPAKGRRASLAIYIIFSLCFVVPMLLQRELWPFSHYPMFGRKLPAGRATFHFLGINEGGKVVRVKQSDNAYADENLWISFSENHIYARNGGNHEWTRNAVRSILRARRVSGPVFFVEERFHEGEGGRPVKTRKVTELASALPGWEP